MLDLPAAYRSVHIDPHDRPYQGFVWDINWEERYFQDNGLCFGLKCAPYIVPQLTEFIVRCMDLRGHSGIFGYLDDFLIVAETKEDCYCSAMLPGICYSLG